MPGNKIFIKASSTFDKDVADELEFKTTFLHEYFHVLTWGSDSPEGGNMPWVDKYAVPRDFYEGTTELMILLYLSRKGVKPKI